MNNQRITHKKSKEPVNRVSTFAQQDWQSRIYEGLVIDNTTTKVAKGNITKPNYRFQIAEPMTTPTYEIAADNFRNRGLKVHSREKFMLGRTTAFLPQE
jgi:hypothetical protein